MKYENEKLIVLYGSQTGNSQELAERIWRDSKRFYFRTIIKALDEYSFQNIINDQCVIFVCSTTGQGEEPDNMKLFWRCMLNKYLSPITLNKLRFAVFGLGDSSYTKFNFVAKRLYKRLQHLGANPLLSLGLGDDQHDLGYDGAADPWLEDLWSSLLKLYPLPIDENPLPKNYLISPRWEVKIIKLQNTKILEAQSIYYSTRKPSDFTVKVLENKRLTTTDHFQDVRLIRFDIGTQLYYPGDVISLRPRNLPHQIEEFKRVLSSNGVDIAPNSVFCLIQKDTEIGIPEVLKYNVTFDQLCSEYFDLMNIPRRHTFRILAQLTDSDLEKEKCLELASAEGQEDFFSYAYRPKRNIVEVLGDFPHATKNLTSDVLFEILPPIKPRDFSIASNFKTHQNDLHIFVAVVKYKTKLQKERLGLASNYLGTIDKDTELTALVKRGSFRFPENSDKPVIMVGPGTGVAPFRNYIYERVMSKNSNSDNLILFYGCRNKEKDFLCREEFENLHNQGLLTLVPAFSRDGSKKVYVQHKIMEFKDVVWKSLQTGGSIYIAGNAKNMPQGVRKAFMDVCVQCGNLTEDEAGVFIQKLEKTNRYQTECW